MASFTDIIPKFNPYIQQLPVEAMVAVGMQKQQRYDEGIQKIQSKIEEVAGINVIRPVDKQYLQSKLNELGSNLKSVAAGDFSNFQLVNSVGGMVGKVTKDPFVIAAVKSTVQDQKNQQKMEEDRELGKLAPENEYFYQLQKQKYLNSGLQSDDGSPITFSGKYLPFKDVRAKLRELAKDVEIDESIVQNLFNADGTVNKVTVETLTKGKDVDKVYNAFVNGLDEQDYRQLNITGMYKNKNLDTNQLIALASTSSNKYIATLQNKKVDIETEMANLKSKLPSVKKDEAAIINKQLANATNLINKIDQKINETKADIKKTAEFINKGADDEDYLNNIRGKLYTQSFLKEVTEGFSQTISHVKYTKNPLWEAIMEEKKFALDSWYKQQRISVEKRKAAASEKANKIAEQQMVPGTIGVGALKGDNLNVVSRVNTDYANKVGQRDSGLMQLALWDMKRLGWDDKKIKSWIDDGMKAGKTREELLSGFGTATLSNIKTGRIKAAPEIANQVKSLQDLNTFISGFKATIEQADARAKQEGGSEVADVSDMMKGAKDQTFSYVSSKDGVKRQYTLTPSDQLDLARIFKTVDEFISSKESKKAKEEAEARLVKKFGADGYNSIYRWGTEQSRDLDNKEAKANFGDLAKTYIPIVGSYYAFKGGMNLIAGEPFGGKPVKAPENLSSFQKVNRAYKSNAYENFKNVQEKVYQEVFSGHFPINEAVILTDKSRPAFDASLAAMFSDRPEYADLKKLLDDPKSQLVVTTTPPISGFGPSEISIRVVAKDDKEVKMTEPIQMNDLQYETLMQKKPPQVNQGLNLADAMVNSSPDNSSNPKGLGSITTSKFTSDDFQNVSPDVRKNILGGDFIRDATGLDLYYPKIYYKSGNSNSPSILNINAPMSLQEVLGFPSGVNNNNLKVFISNK